MPSSEIFSGGGRDIRGALIAVVKLVDWRQLSREYVEVRFVDPWLAMGTRGEKWSWEEYVVLGVVGVGVVEDAKLDLDGE